MGTSLLRADSLPDFKRALGSLAIDMTNLSLQSGRIRQSIRDSERILHAIRHKTSEEKQNPHRRSKAVPKGAISECFASPKRRTILRGKPCYRTTADRNGRSRPAPPSVFLRPEVYGGFRFGEKEDDEALAVAQLRNAWGNKTELKQLWLKYHPDKGPPHERVLRTRIFQRLLSERRQMQS